MRLLKRISSEEFLRQLKRVQRIQSWLLVTAWILSIYIMACFAVPLADFLESAINLNFLMAMLFLFVSFFFILSLFSKAGFDKIRTFSLTLVTILVFGWFYFRAAFHAKQYHLIEYSILSYLIYAAARRDIKGARVIFLAFIGATLVGMGDEGLQCFIPGRYPSLLDVVVDMKAAALGLVFAGIVDFEKKLLALHGGRKNPREAISQ